MVDELASRSTVHQISHLLGRISLIAIGAPMAAIMAIVAFYEIGASDFFGSCVSLMVVVFGAQLIAIGLRGSAGPTPGRPPPDPLEKLWRSEERVDIIRPSHAKLDIRGRP